MSPPSVLSPLLIFPRVFKCLAGRRWGGVGGGTGRKRRSWEISSKLLSKQETPRSGSGRLCEVMAGSRLQVWVKLVRGRLVREQKWRQKSTVPPLWDKQRGIHLLLYSIPRVWLPHLSVASMKIAASSKNVQLHRCEESAELQETMRVSRLSALTETRGRPTNMCSLNFGSFSSCKDAFSLPLSLSDSIFLIFRSHALKSNTTCAVRKRQSAERRWNKPQTNVWITSHHPNTHSWLKCGDTKERLCRPLVVGCWSYNTLTSVKLFLKATLVFSCRETGCLFKSSCFNSVGEAQ